MTCDDCNRARPVMVAMQPGRDGKPWSLCGRCWLDGVKPWIPAAAIPAAGARSEHSADPTSKQRNLP